MDKNTIVIVEGPRGSGKTPVVDTLVMSGLTQYKCLFIPPELGTYDGFLSWNTSEQSYAEMLAISNAYDFGCNVVMHRGVMSWCAYNCSVSQYKIRLGKWFEVLSKWKCPIIVCLDSDNDKLEQNVLKKGWDGNTDIATPDKFREMYNLVPDDMKIYYKINDYDSNWIFDIECKIMNKTLMANTFHNFRRPRKRVQL
jgi:hypothetical protein